MTSLRIAWASIFLVFMMTPLSNGQELNWGENVGPVSAIIVKADNVQGLTVYSLPEKESPIVGYVRPGLIVQAYDDFRNGWVKLKSPIDRGWVQIEGLQPYPYQALAIRVNPTSLCLPIRRVPETSGEQIGCGYIGQILGFTGVMTSNGWLQLEKGIGWVHYSQVQAQPATAEVPGTVRSNAAAAMQRTVQRQVAQRESAAVSSPDEQASALGETVISDPGGYFAIAGAQSSNDSVATKQAATQIGCNKGYCVAVLENGQASYFRNGEEIQKDACLNDPACTAAFVTQYLRWKAQRGENQSLVVIPPTNQRFSVNSNGTILAQDGAQVAMCSVESGTVSAPCLQDFLAEKAAGSHIQVPQPAAQ
ncbi:MAG TPA: SH3 domain-containing protein [Desulfomonilaceae bacterium]|nr:SH3 domain-containing protein [Desulfomonilaceae bacterium]